MAVTFDFAPNMAKMFPAAHLKADLKPAVGRRHRLQGGAQLLLENIAVEIEPDALGVVLDAAEEVDDNLDMRLVVAVALVGLGVLQRELNLVLLLRLRLLGAGEVGLEQDAKLLRHLLAQSGAVREARA